MRITLCSTFSCWGYYFDACSLLDGVLVNFSLGLSWLFTQLTTDHSSPSFLKANHVKHIYSSPYITPPPMVPQSIFSVPSSKQDTIWTHLPPATYLIPTLISYHSTQVLPLKLYLLCCYWNKILELDLVSFIEAWIRWLLLPWLIKSSSMTSI